MDSHSLADAVRASLQVAPAEIQPFLGEKNGKTYSASYMTTLLNNRLSISGNNSHPIERTTFQWRDGLLNFRNIANAKKAVHDRIWTNIREHSVESWKATAAVTPFVFVISSWFLMEEEHYFHTWVFPSELIFDALPHLPASKDQSYRTIAVYASKQRFQNWPDSPSLGPYYCRIDLAAEEHRQLTMAASADRDRQAQKQRDKKSELMPVLVNTVDVGMEEGRARLQKHRRFERNRTIVNRKKRAALRIGQLHCEVCGFDFVAVYGSLGFGFIECHHVVPLHVNAQPKRTTLDDLALVCSNCHRMLHRSITKQKRSIDIHELREIMAPIRQRGATS